jgi:hypothetical protein
MLVGGQVGFDSFDRLQHAGTCQLFFPLKDPTENAVFFRPLNTVAITTVAASELSVGSQSAIRIDHYSYACKALVNHKEHRCLDPNTNPKHLIELE